MMLALAVSSGISGKLMARRKYRRQLKVAAPKLLSAKPYGTNKIVLKWSHGKRCKRLSCLQERRTEENGRQCVIFLDIRQRPIRILRVTKGEQYTYTVRAYKRDQRQG